MLNVMNQNLNLRVSVLSVVVTVMMVRIFVARVVDYLIMLYLVTRGAYDEFEVLGCFTDKEKAQKYAEYYAAEITEFAENPTVPVFDEKLYSVRCDLKTNKVWAYRVPNDRKISEWQIWYPRHLIVSVVSAYSEDDAVTIGRNHYEQIRAGKMKVLDADRKTYVVWNWEIGNFVTLSCGFMECS